MKSTYAASYLPEHLQISALLLVHKGSPCLIKRRMRAQPFVLPALWFTMLAIVMHGTIHPGASAVIGYLISSNMSKTAHAGSEPTFYFHVLQYVFFNNLIYKGLWL